MVDNVVVAMFDLDGNVYYTVVGSALMEKPNWACFFLTEQAISTNEKNEESERTSKDDSSNPTHTQ